MAIKTVPRTVPEPGTVVVRVGARPPRSVLRAGPLAVRAWEVKREADLREQADARARSEAAVADRAQVLAGIDETVALAKGRDEDAEVRDGGVVLLARDGLHWLRQKRDLHDAHYRAGLKFREDYERANGTGPASCLKDGVGGGAFGPADGPSHAMLIARDRVKRALAALGTPMLVDYVVGVAGEGLMLTDRRFVADARHAQQHLLPLVIALDLLARHYGMVK